MTSTSATHEPDTPHEEQVATRPRVSVVVPMFQAESHIEACLDSLKNQLLKKLEVIVVDDASTDMSRALVQRYMKEHPQFSIRLYQLRENRGVSVARNEGWTLARGDYVGFVDPDDTVSPDMYLELLRQVERSGGEAAGCGAQIVERGRLTGTLSLGHGNAAHSGIQLLEYMCRGAFPSSVCFMLFPVELVTRVRFRPGVRFEDFIFLTEALPLLSEVVVTDRPLYTYQRRSGTETGSLRSSVTDLLVGQEAATQAIDKLWDPVRSRPLVAHLALRMNRTMAHQVFAFGEGTQLGEEVLGMALDNTKWKQILRCLVSGDLPIVASSAALKLSPSLYGRAFRRRRSRRVRRATGRGQV
ncbi:MAG: glycosyltransferase [Cryobacterium sp.]|nr:glycosyltransferase [Cryobacterium sp.]